MHDNSGISVLYIYTYRLVFAMTYSAKVPSILDFRKNVATFGFNANFMLIYYTMVLELCQYFFAKKRRKRYLSMQ